jgi:hypothetical protein
MSQLSQSHPPLVQGLCGALVCPRLCNRAEHCEVGLRRRKQLLAERARRRLWRRPNSRQIQVCNEVLDANLCPTLCHQHGGCFLPVFAEHESESRRKVHRANRIHDELRKL